MRRSKFSGVFSFSTDWTENRHKSHYFVWELPDGAFAVQELNKAFQPLVEPERISARAFAKNFKAEPEILAMPVTTPNLSHLENKTKPAADNTSAQQAAPEGTPQPKAQGIPQPQSQDQAGAARLDAVIKAAAQAAAQGAPQIASKTPAQSATGAAPQAQLRDAATAREAEKSATASTNAGQRAAASAKGAASSSQPGNAGAAATKPGAQRLQPAQKAPRAQLRVTAAEERQSAALQKSVAPAMGGDHPQGADGQAAGKKIFAVEADTDTRLTQRGSSPVAGSQMSMEAIRKAKMTEKRLRETFRQTLLRLNRPRERQAALSALEQLAGATENICTMHKHMFRDFGVRLRQSSQPALALLFSRKVVELAPDDDHAHFNLARILCMLGQFDEAAAHIRAAMNAGGDEPTYFRMLVHIRKEKLQNRGQSDSSAR